ncbi:MAG TPA: cation:proton antiporter [Sporichthyaceae bacterium]|nr:cation:proton antiporter [Sporichthyaceae bacterium]
MPTDVEFTNLLAVVAVALAAPLLLGLAPRLRIPAAVLEILGGVALGPSGFDVIEVDTVVAVMAVIGLAFLLFLAGLELDPHALRGRTLRLALLGYAITLALGSAVGAGVVAADWTGSAGLVALALSATSLGLVVPVLKDAGQATAPTGRLTIGAASVADFAAIILLALLFSGSDGSPGERAVLLGGFAALVAATAVALSVAGRSMRLGDLLVRLQDTTAEIRVRATVVLLIAFVALAEKFGLESILGAFLAGAVVAVLDKDTASHPQLRTKLDAIGYGFVIPVFFVASGIRLDLRGLFDDPGALARVPLFLLALLVVRGVPAILFARQIGRRAALAAGLLQATSLPFIVTATQIGVLTGRMDPVTAAALSCAGLLSVLLFPAAALALLRTGEAPPVNGVAMVASVGGNEEPQAR